MLTLSNWLAWQATYAMARGSTIFIPISFATLFCVHLFPWWHLARELASALSLSMASVALGDMKIALKAWDSGSEMINISGSGHTFSNISPLNRPLWWCKGSWEWGPEWVLRKSTQQLTMRKWESEYDSSQGVLGRLFGWEGVVKDILKWEGASEGNLEARWSGWGRRWWIWEIWIWIRVEGVERRWRPSEDLGRLRGRREMYSKLKDNVL